MSLAIWLCVIALIAIVYIALCFSSTETSPTESTVEPAASLRPLHVGRNLLLGAIAFILLDAIIFHTPVYTSVLAPDSYAGRLAVIMRAEKQRAPSGLKEVLVLGDSRIAEGFSTAVADELGSAAGLKFVSLAEPASTIVIWHYILREVDPTAQRYSAIVVPYGVGYEPDTAGELRISMAAPMLRYGDCFRFASAFQQWSNRFRAFTACILRGSAYQSDALDLIQHPVARLRSIQLEATRLRSRAAYEGRNYDIAGTSYDPKTRKVSFPPNLTEAQRQIIRQSLDPRPESERDHFVKLQRGWIQQIFDRYSNSSTAIVLTPVPRSPFGGLPGVSVTGDPAFPSTLTKRAAFSLPEQTFNFLEKPEYYFDAYHLNAKGRRIFTEKLVGELVGRLHSGDVQARLTSVHNSLPGTPVEVPKVTSGYFGSQEHHH